MLQMAIEPREREQRVARRPGVEKRIAALLEGLQRVSQLRLQPLRPHQVPRVGSAGLGCFCLARYGATEHRGTRETQSCGLSELLCSPGSNTSFVRPFSGRPEPSAALQ
jgi:hypothetical protein